MGRALAAASLLPTLHGRKGTKELRAELLALGAGTAPRLIDSSLVLQRLTPDDVCAAVKGVRVGRNLEERKEAVARIAQQRQHASVRVREEEAVYTAT